MFIKLRYTAASNFRHFHYNFHWSDYLWILDGPMSRWAGVMAPLGYLILLNDFFAKNIDFTELAGHTNGFLNMNSGTRFRYLYLGFLFLFCGNVLYKFRRPPVLKFAPDEFRFAEWGIKNYTLQMFVDLHGSLQRVEPRTLEGKYKPDDFDKFKAATTSKHTDLTTNPRFPVGKFDHDWSNATQAYEGLLRSMLIEHYIRSVSGSRFWLLVCLLFSGTGGLLVAIPSLNIFVRVMMIIVAHPVPQ